MQLNCRILRRALLLGLGLATAATPALAQRGGGGSHSSRSYSPRSSTPRSYTPRSYTPRAPRTRSYTPRSYAPRSSTPRSHSPKIHVPKSPRPRAYSPHRSTTPRSYAPRTPVPPGERDSHGRIKRSATAKEDFMKRTGHPHGWPGHVVDHVVPLACGGADAPSNMQWQTTEEAKAKDKVERRGCSRR